MRLNLNLGALRAIRNSPGVIADISARAERIASAAGEGVQTRPAETGKERARRAVITETWRAAHNEAKHRTLTRAIDAGR